MRYEKFPLKYIDYYSTSLYDHSSSTGYLNFLKPHQDPQEDWKEIKIEHWTVKDTMSWIIDCANFEKINILDIPLWNFKITGVELINLNLDQFVIRMGHIGVESHKTKNIGMRIFNRLRIGHENKAVQTNLSDNDNSDISDGEIDFSPVNIKNNNCGEKKDSRAQINSNVIESTKGKRKNPAILRFLVNLLLDQNYCPSSIKWEDYSQGTFRFVNDVPIIERWFNRNRNSNKPFDAQHFYRAIRYHYKSGAISPVEGKKAVLKFGPNVPDYRTDDPNFVKANSNKWDSNI